MKKQSSKFITSKKVNLQKGFALVMALFGLLLLSILAFCLISVTTVQSRVINNQLRLTRAYYIARSGISRALNELKGDYWWATSESQTYEIGEADNTISVWASPDNLNSPNKLWKITSTAEVEGASRTLIAWAELESFSIFCYFTNEEKTAGGYTIWFTDRDALDGRVHTDGYFSIYSNPRFSEKVTSSNEDDPYYDEETRTYDGGIIDPSKFYHPYYSYSSDRPMPLDDSEDFSFAGGEPVIPLPEDTSEIKDAADYEYTGETSFKFLPSGKIEVTNSGEVEEISSSGVTIHVDGNTIIKGGKIHGRVTIGSTGTVKIQDSCVYKDEDKDVLGIVSEGDIVVDTNPYVAQDIEIDAMLMTLTGSFRVGQYDRGVPRGTLTILGGLIQKVRGPVGTFNPYSGQMVTGYSKNYVYDEKLINLPPMNFPTTGRIKLISIQDLGALGSPVSE